MTRVNILDGTAVTLQGPSGGAVVSGPGVFDCDSVTVSGTAYTGTLVVTSAGAFQALRFHPYHQAAVIPGMCLFLVLGIMFARLRV